MDTRAERGHVGAAPEPGLRKWHAASRSCFIILLILYIQCNLGGRPQPFVAGIIHKNGRFAILTTSSAILLERFDVHTRNVTATMQVWTRNGFPPYTNPGDFVKRWEGNIFACLQPPRPS